jgi:hypothetical protein
MKTLLGIGAVVVISFAAGCTITNSGTPDNGANGSNGVSGGDGSGSAQGGGSTSGSKGDGGASGEGGSSSSSSSDDGGGSAQPVSTNPAAISFGSSCPGFNACGGDISGTWDYSGGCIADPFAAAKKQCPSATESNVSGNVVGTVNVFGNTIQRNAKATFTGTLTIPAECTMGASCAIVQQTLKAGYDSVVCSGSASCDCVVSGHVDTGSVSTFTMNGNTVTTDDGSTYDVCVAGNMLTEHETDANAAEPGVFQLTKR